MKHPIKHTLLAGLIFFSLQLSAQFGVRLKYNSSSFPNYEKHFNQSFQTDNKAVFNNGMEAGADYWFRLKKQRIEFMPELAYSLASTTFNAAKGLDKVSLTGIHFNFHTHIYALDMEGDCNCPTFSKQGASFNKGLFFHVTPGIGYYSTSTTVRKDDLTPINYKDANSLVFRAGVGIGLDLGVSDLLTITPILSYYFHTKMDWEGIPSVGDFDIYHKVSDNQKLLQLTVRLGFRPDYTSGRRYR